MKRTLLTLVLCLAPAAAHAQPGAGLPSWLRLDRAAPGPRVPDDASTPLSARARRVATAVPDEGTPDPGEHYPVSNEWRHDLWFEHVRDLGGAFVGVGTDQCYTLAAVQRARMIWVVDFDPLVPLVHRIYEVLVPASGDPDALVARFAEEEREATEALLAEGLAGDPDADRIQRVYRRNRARMHRYLRRVRRNRPHGTAASWLGDPSLYAYVRALFEGGRVVARNGDVTADGALRAVGRAAAQLEIPVRVVYFSNAEQFFPYRADFRENLEALPTDERSVVLRTFRESEAPYPEGDTWHYMVQPVDDLRARIRENGYRHSRQLVMDLMSSRADLGDDGLSVLDGDVPRRFDLTD
ncbi:MAG TPA: hypothetical protein RMH99_32490 [Sandaracinaceae bacterium LLY-WYZ-13_1]|nr:hypothetical protein [Sandaracinaceae bacterium LLY-WYZ-13_1]